VKYWEIIIENLRNSGWNCGSVATTDRDGRQFWVVAPEREDAGRFIVEADQELPAFLELESAIQIHRDDHECDCPEPDEELGSGSLHVSLGSTQCHTKVELRPRGQSAKSQWPPVFSGATKRLNASSDVKCLLGDKNCDLFRSQEVAARRGPNE
jgi:hypothetical protein